MLALAAGPAWRGVCAAGAAVAQRPLAGAGLAPAGAIERGPVRVVLVDGLAAADVARVPAYAQVCARGAALTVDVGFPTKSLPVEAALWTGRTPGQLGLAFSNDRIATPAGAIPPQVAGSIAVVENTRGIAGSFGFAALAPGPEADADADADADARPDPAAARAWQDRGFGAAAEAAAAGAAPLVFVHVLAVDDAAHAGGRRGDAYARALAYADAIVARVARATPPGAALLVLADHGHVARGGHGDAEAEVRLVRACIAPAPAGLGGGPAAGGEAPAASGAAPAVHLIDLARWLADRLGARLADDARGRPLAVAIAHPDPDATLPAPGGAAWLAAALVLAAIGAAARRGGAPWWALAWPVAALALAVVGPGLPSLSARPHLAGAWIATSTPVAAVALGLLARGWRAAGSGAAAATSERRDGRAIAWACAAPPAALAVASAILCGAPAAALGGAPARVPWWTGELLFWLPQLGAGLIAAGAAGLALALVRGGRRAPRP